MHSRAGVLTRDGITTPTCVPGPSTETGRRVTISSGRPFRAECPPTNSFSSGKTVTPPRAAVVMRADAAPSRDIVAAAPRGSNTARVRLRPATHRVVERRPGHGSTLSALGGRRGSQTRHVTQVPEAGDVRWPPAMGESLECSTRLGRRLRKPFRAPSVTRAGTPRPCRTHWWRPPRWCTCPGAPS